MDTPQPVDDSSTYTVQDDGTPESADLPIDGEFP